MAQPSYEMLQYHLPLEGAFFSGMGCSGEPDTSEQTSRSLLEFTGRTEVGRPSAPAQQDQNPRVQLACH